MGREPAMLAPLQARVSMVACHPKQDILAAGYSDGTILMVRLNDGAEILVRRNGTARVSALAWNSRGTMLAFAAEEWRRRAAGCRPCWPVPGNNAFRHPLIPRTIAVNTMPPDDRKRSYRREMLLATAMVAAGLIVSGLSLADLAVRNPQVAQATPPAAVDTGCGNQAFQASGTGDDRYAAGRDRTAAGPARCAGAEGRLEPRTATGSGREDRRADQGTVNVAPGSR